MAIPAVLLICYIGYLYYSEHAPQTAPPRPVPPVLDAAVSDLCQDIPGQLPEPGRVLKPTILLPLENDRENFFTDRLRTALDRQGWYRPVEAGLLDRTLDTVREFTGIGTGASAQSMQWSPPELANMMRSANAETVLRGSVDRLALPEGGPVEIQLRLELWELSPTDPTIAVLIRSLNLERPLPTLPEMSTDAPKPPRQTGFWSYAVIFLIGLAYPFAMIPWMRRAIGEDSNAAILIALLGITAIPVCVFLGYLIWLGTGMIGIVVQGGLVALCLFFYTAFILNRIQNTI